MAVKKLKELTKFKIFGAKKYLQKFLDTMDASFREMANARRQNGDEKKKLKGYENKIA